MIKKTLRHRDKTNTCGLYSNTLYKKVVRMIFEACNLKGMAQCLSFVKV